MHYVLWIMHHSHTCIVLSLTPVVNKPACVCHSSSVGVSLGKRTVGVWEWRESLGTVPVVRRVTRPVKACDNICTVVFDVTELQPLE